ncbi:head-tail connector protein [Sphingomonas sp. Leaf242]|uniref:head-tail connector protein n=1 Tax=Sphingomonas sp. Leaf242 TaxID=1736304 RepID=UPI000713FF2B|nr:head-tail connector protein [Sphingomonas sp. Leaf242]KQO13276.1 hypothetical protein ASF09_03235 [Sphingomonas sp. Leaf242]
MRVVVITPPEPVVTIDEAKRHLKQDSDDDADLIKTYVAAATQHLDGPDGWLGRAIGVQTLEARLSVIDGDCIRLPYKPIIDLVSISWLGADRTEHAGQIADFDLFDDDLAPESGSWAWEGCSLKREAIRIRYRAGYLPRAVGETTVSTVPEPIKAAILLMTGDLYRNRSTITDKATFKVPMSTTVTNLLDPIRIYR